MYSEGVNILRAGLRKQENLILSSAVGPFNISFASDQGRIDWGYDQGL